MPPSPHRPNSEPKSSVWVRRWTARAPRMSLQDGPSWEDSMIKRWRNMTNRVRSEICYVAFDLRISRLIKINLWLLDWLSRCAAIASSLKEFKGKFDKGASIVRWLGTNGMRMVLQFWCAKRPLFWIPRGWVPWYVEWLLAFPRAPRGSVSIQIWGIACATVIQLVGTAVVATWVLGQTRRQERAQKVKVSIRDGTRERKKEL